MVSNHLSWKSTGWFILVPTLITACCALILPLHPQALERVLNEQHMLEKELSAIETDLENPSIPTEKKYTLFKQAEDITRELMQYKPSLTRDHYYQGFIVLISLAFFLLLLSIMNYFSLSLRLGLYCSGMILAIISFLQWQNAFTSAPTYWRAKMASFMSVIIGFGALAFCILFMLQLYRSKK